MRRRTSPTCGGQPCSPPSRTRTPVACTCSPTRVSGCSPGSEDHRQDSFLVLDQNLRNTRQIANSFSTLASMRMRLGAVDGPAVRFLECSGQDALDTADDEVDVLLDNGWRVGDVALLATGSRHPEQRARQDGGQDKYWDTFWDLDQIFYGHVLGFKGLERPAVVLALNENEPGERSKERLYVGLSRARDQLVVCGDPAFVEEVGGSAVLRHLRGRCRS